MDPTVTDQAQHQSALHNPSFTLSTYQYECRQPIRNRAGPQPGIPRQNQTHTHSLPLPPTTSQRQEHIFYLYSHYTAGRRRSHEATRKIRLPAFSRPGRHETESGLNALTINAYDT